jgi:CheY-like chemotaxis protein
MRKNFMPHPSQPITILAAEDDPDDCILVQDAFSESGQTDRLYFVEDGVKLLQYLRRQDDYAEPAAAPRPDLILLDLNMPRKDGRESLAEIKADPNLRGIPVVVLTTSGAEEDVLYTYDLGIAGYITKPDTFQQLVEIVKGLKRYWSEVVELFHADKMNHRPHDFSAPHTVH